MTICAADINVDLLPQLLRELADIIGLDATLKLTEEFPGVSVYVPDTPRPHHKIALIIGFDNLVALSNIYGKDYLAMPKLDAATRQIKHALIRDMRGKLSTRQMALATGYTSRRVQQIKSENHAKSPQQEMFGK
ncbi:MAG: hypothetical protein JKX92_12275 [Porticoccaceae bacterium]|nr:hypothetical protein [Porticoccaceae bacterium]